jgi:hypothetical protein
MLLSGIPFCGSVNVWKCDAFADRIPAFRALWDSLVKRHGRKCAAAKIISNGIYSR